MEEKKEHREADVALARNLCAAVIAYRMGIGMDYTKKTYLKDTPGEYWFQLAALVNSDWNKQCDDLMKPPEGPQLVQ